MATAGDRRKLAKGRSPFGGSHQVHLLQVSQTLVSINQQLEKLNKRMKRIEQRVGAGHGSGGGEGGGGGGGSAAAASLVAGVGEDFARISADMHELGDGLLAAQGVSAAGHRDADGGPKRVPTGEVGSFLFDGSGAFGDATPSRLAFQ
jgi:hypothetical protein